MDFTETNVIHCGDALDILKQLPNKFVNCIVTSPPYYGLRDYGGMDEQLGLEDTPQAYIARMVEIFREARRVLRDDGTVWCNMGDSFADKQLMMMPHRLAIALQDDGWYVRSDIVWHKPNPMPESVTDRPTKAHEYIFLLSKSARYWYDADAVRETAKEWTGQAATFARNNEVGFHVIPNQTASEHRPNRTDVIDTSNGRNLRSVWTVATQPYAAAHFATFPPDLIRPCVKAGCPGKVCAMCGAPYVREVEREPMVIRKTDRSALGEFGRTQSSGTMLTPASSTTLGFNPTCDHNADTRPGIVLDMFMGSGTTAIVAKQERRQYVGIELNPEYVELAKDRFRTGTERLNAQDGDPLEDLPLFSKKGNS